MDQYYPAVKALYDDRGRKPLFSAEFVSHPHCLPSPNSALTSSNEGNPNFSCNDLFAQVMKIGTAPSTQKVVFGGNWWLSPGYNGEALRSFGGAIRELKAHGKQVFVILDNPQGDEFDPLAIMRMNRLNAYFGNGQNIARGNRAVPSDKVEAESEARQIEFRKITAQNGAVIIDPYLYLCPHKQCPVLIEGEPTHRDTNHLRPFYSRKFGAAMFRDIVFAQPQ